eukprot:1147432-Pelagomonas_calceolata.AAC.10
MPWKTKCADILSRGETFCRCLEIHGGLASNIDLRPTVKDDKDHTRRWHSVKARAWSVLN